jgi:two-component system, OmpR family, response regulator
MRILVIEDDHKVAGAIKKGLEHESYAVDVVYTGTDGYDCAETGEYDLIIMDHMLPGREGTALAKQLRDKKIHTPILMLTSKGQMEDGVEGLESGVDDYLVKPFAFSGLYARIRALIPRPKIAVDSLLTFKDLQLNTNTYEVSRSNNPIQLSSKEYTLLEYLLRHKNKIVTKEQIMNNVWDYNAVVMPNSVEVYIRHLRNKLEKPFGKEELIKTIRGFGYMMGE